MSMKKYDAGKVDILEVSGENSQVFDQFGMSVVIA